jgi:ArsR family transcriptional regulator
VSPGDESDEFDELFELLGSRTRYEILRLLTREPMFLGQLSRELSVGQQALIRHLRQLLEQGLLETYEDESIRGPPRKYYRLNKCVRLSINIAPEGVRIVRIMPGATEPQNVEEVLRQNYPELQRLVVRAERLSEIPDLLDRKREAIVLIKQLESESSEFQDVGRYLRSIIKWIRDNHL